MGFDHANRGVGIRDHQLILPSVVCSTHVARRIATSVGSVTFAHQHGCGIIGNDVGGITQYFASLAKHPNIGSVLIVGLGCETIQGNELAEKLINENSSTKYLIIQESGGVAATVDAGIRFAKELSKEYPSAIAEIKKLKIGFDFSNSNNFSNELAEELRRLGHQVILASSHKNSGLNFSELMEAGVHLIISFPQEGQPASGFPFIPTITIASASPLHQALIRDFDFDQDSSIQEIIGFVIRVAHGEVSKVEKLDIGEIIAPRVVRSV